MASRSSHERVLRPFTWARPGDSGSDLVPARLRRRIAIQVLHQKRARTHEAHVASQHVDELWQLVKTRRAKQLSRDAESIRIRDRRTGRDLAHRPELENRERTAVQARAALTEQDRSDRSCQRTTSATSAITGDSSTRADAAMPMSRSRFPA